MAAHSSLSRTTRRARGRLQLTQRFLDIGRQGRWARGQWVSVGALPNSLSFTRLGLRVQRGTKGAVIRNRAKRVFRSVYRANQGALLPGYDLVVVIRRAAEVTSGSLAEDFLATCKTLRILGRPAAPSS